MRSQAALVRQYRLVLDSTPTSLGRTFHTSTRRLLRKPARRYRQPAATVNESIDDFRRLVSSDLPPPSEQQPEPTQSASGPSDSPSSPSEPDKPKRRTRSSKESAASSHPLPTGLQVLWTPESNVPPLNATALPPPQILEDVLHNFHITLHPQTQHRAVYASANGPPSEPTFALYCPIEGGDYVLDETVRELARRTGSDVIVLDAVQLAAGECGQFGKAANALQLPENPLHFPSTSASSSARSPPRPAQMDEDDDDSETMQIVMPSQMTFHVVRPANGRSQGRTFLATTARNASASKQKAFFDELINIAPPRDDDAPAIPPGRPRIIYIRDFPTLAPTSASWYPALLAAVRQRRQGPISRPTSPVSRPTTIVFGMTPPLIGSPSSPSSTAAQGLMGLIMSRQGAAPITSSQGPARGGWNEDELSDKARERRLRERLRRWERGDTLASELPTLQLDADGESSGEARNAAEVVLGGGSGGAVGFPGGVLAPLLSAIRAGSGGGNAQTSPNTSFYKTSIVVPSVRSSASERTCRIARRHEINELTMKMGIATAGGVLESLPRTEEAASPAPAQAEGEVETKPVEDTVKEEKPETPKLEQPDAARMWTEWGNKIETWSSVRHIADRAVGSVVAATYQDAISSKLVLEPTPVPWSAVHKAWSAQKLTRDLRKAWTQESAAQVARERVEDEEEEDIEAAIGGENDEVVERVKRDPDLEQHEQRLLGCIVSSGSLPTSFAQVHLPAHTIDSVRTIVSLPLLYPDAFNHGILKEHGMTGCLLFGPPGTGKTLLARALAKEAGCRMLAIAPSDVMDMYVGEGEKLVKSVFSLARRLSPCVVFIDEIDALFGARSSGRESGGAIAHRGVLTEFMQEMDGLRSSREDNIIVIGATNRPFDLDDAVLRRLPRRLLVDLPGDKEREEILKILLRDETLAPDVDLKTLAKRTETFSGSDLKHLCVSAALDAVKEGFAVPWASTASDKQIPAPTTPPAATTEAVAPVESAVDAPSTSEATVEVADEAAQESVVASPEASSTTDITTNTDGTKDSSSPASSEAPSIDAAAAEKETRPIPSRQLSWNNFAKALKEISPSASESLGTLSELRKWNEEFGEGRKDKKRVQVWGKGRFGFTIPGLSDGPAEGHVGSTNAEERT